jgi:hypothetical protein
MTSAFRFISRSSSSRGESRAGRGSRHRYPLPMARDGRNDPTIEPTELDYAHAGGFVDGEGSITVRWSTWNPSAYASVTVSQVDRRTLDWMAERWGCAVGVMANRRNRTRGQGHEWCVVGHQAYRFLRGVRPMLKAKGEQADNALRFEAMRRPRGRKHGWTLSQAEMQLHCGPPPRRWRTRARRPDGSKALGSGSPSTPSEGTDSSRVTEP